MKSYRDFVASISNAIDDAGNLPLGQAKAESRTELPADAPKVLLFSPHPDDEVITGILPLRLLRQSGHRVINVAVTLGRHKDRKMARLEELRGCCKYIGFELMLISENGIGSIKPATRKDDPQYWGKCTEHLGMILRTNCPNIIFFPHNRDWHPTHIATHMLILDALQMQDPDYSCHCFETELWATMDNPNLMVESSADDLADLLTALSFHVGEVKRNPYHLSLPSWMIDNVRRGSELVGERGGPAADFRFATLYRHRLWKDGGLQEISTAGRFFSADENPDCLGLLPKSG